MKYPYKNMDDFLANSTTEEFAEYCRIMGMIRAFMFCNKEDEPILEFVLSFCAECVKEKPENWEILLEKKLFG